MKKVKILFTAAAFTLCITACSSTRHSGSGTTPTNSGMTPYPGATNPGTTSPGTTSPSTTNPGTTSPSTTSPSTTNPGTTNSADSSQLK